jgi:predicted nucleotidyltransferase
MIGTPERDLLPDLFGTRERVALLSDILDRESCTVQEISDATRITKGLVSRYLALLAREGILVREGRRYHLRLTAMTRQVKILVNISRARTIVSLPAWARGIGLYGSWASGTNTKESDLDIWIAASVLPDELVVAALERFWKKKCSCELHLLLLTPEKLKAMKTGDEPFFSSFERTAITLGGTGYDAAG